MKKVIIFFICFLFISLGCNKKNSLINTIGSEYNLSFKQTNKQPKFFVYISNIAKDEDGKMFILMGEIKNSIDKELGVLGNKKKGYERYYWTWETPECEVELSQARGNCVKICYTEK